MCLPVEGKKEEKTCEEHKKRPKKNELKLIRCLMNKISCKKRRKRNETKSADLLHQTRTRTLRDIEKKKTFHGYIDNLGDPDALSVRIDFEKSFA